MRALLILQININWFDIEVSSYLQQFQTPIAAAESSSEIDQKH